MPISVSQDLRKMCIRDRCSICTGEQVAGFKDIYTGHFDEIMLIRDTADLDTFMEMYGHWVSHSNIFY